MTAPLAIRVALPETLEATEAAIKAARDRASRAETREAAYHDEFVTQQLRDHRASLVAPKALAYLGTLSSGDFSLVGNRWSRGIDWFVFQAGDQWKVCDSFGPFPLYPTQDEAYENATDVLLAESHRRARAKNASMEMSQ
ncbi:hypothetical protein ACJ4V0_15730 [Phreatobacter sp. HK31-P]